MDMQASDRLRLTVHADQPRLFTVDDFASPAEIDHVLARASDLRSLHRAGIKTRHGVAGFSFEMPVAGDPVLGALTRRTYALLGIGNEVGRTLRFRRYGVGEGHPPHLDCFQTGENVLVATALLYLNDTEDGGATRFPRSHPDPVEVLPQRGRLVVWTNYTAAGEPDPASYHEGALVRAGHKSTLTNFIYQPVSVCPALPSLGRKALPSPS